MFLPCLLYLQGKSSLTAALFRLVEVESGRILVDGVDLATLGLEDVRGRSNGMSIIPQDPFLAGATIRECLDPFGQSGNNEILAALDSVQLRQANEKSQSFELNTPILEGGSNLSVGERQLLNLARALLRQPKILVLDEATASIDGATVSTNGFSCLLTLHVFDGSYSYLSFAGCSYSTHASHPFPWHYSFDRGASFEYNHGQ